MTDDRLVVMLRLAWEMRRASGVNRAPVDNTSLPAGAPMYFKCASCFGDIILPEGYLTKPSLCYDCLNLRERGLLVESPEDGWYWQEAVVLQSGPFAGKTVTLASQVRVALLQPELERLLDALGHPEALVTDESRLSDFNLEAEDASLVEQKIGLQFTSATELLVDVAARMRDTNDDHGQEE